MNRRAGSVTAPSLQTVCISDEEEAMATDCNGSYGTRLSLGISGLHNWRRLVIAFVGAMLMLGAVDRADADKPRGQLTWSSTVSIAPTWFDPAETTGIITPYAYLYALHDAMVKPMPGNPLTPSLAKSWSLSDDGLIYEFVLRDGAKFHNGEPVTSDDVKFSFERYRGAANKVLKARVAGVETPDPQRIFFKLKQPWPDFMTFYTSATSAAWVVPKKYVASVGDEGFKKAPVGAGPYKFVSYTPGLELTLEAYEQYWRKTPSVKRLVFKVIPDEATRLVALKRGEVDIAYAFRGELAEELQRSKGLTSKAIVLDVPFWIYFADQWDPKSPWYDKRVRLAASLAIDHNSINQAITLGHSRVTGSIIPDSFAFYWAPPIRTHDPDQAKQLLAAAGYPKGFDAGDYFCDSSFAHLAEAVINNLQAVGIRAKLRPLERAAFFKGFAEKGLKNLIQGSSGAFGNTATRLEAFVAKGGAYVYGSYPDIDALYDEQVAELDAKKREATLHKIQQLLHERSVYAHLWQLATIHGIGPKVGQSGLGLIAGHPFSTPYEDVTLAGQ
jgi:peptide/nickel transport system substrate-binding protein